MKKLGFAVLGLWGLGACGGSATSNRTANHPGQGSEQVLLTVDSSREARVYKGRDTLKVIVLPVSGHPEADFLLEVQGSDGLADGIVWPVKIETPEGRSVDKAYVTMNRGERRWLLWHETSTYGGSQWKLTFPKDNDGYAWSRSGDEQRVSLHEESAKNVNSSATLNRFQEQQANGSLSIRTEWNRKRRESRIEEALSLKAKDVNKKCGTELSSSVDWASVNDETLKEISVIGYCKDGLRGIETVCSENENVADLLSGTRNYQCQFSEQHGMRKDGQTLVWNPSGTNHDKLARSTVQALLGYNLQVAIAKNGLVMIMDTNEKDPKFYYGKEGTYQRQQMTWLYSGQGGGGIFSPGSRSTLKTGRNWTLQCGKSKLILKEPGVAEKKTLLKNVQLKSYAFTRQPDTLARDSKGNYYYVDRNIDDLGGKNYHVYIGKKGDMKKYGLKDIVDDSEGKIFSTEDGKLRLVTGQEPIWISGNKNVSLKVLPVDNNTDLIFNQLGPYDGQSLGSVCEEF